MKTALTIAGSDCSGGAGIQADLKTFAAFGVYGMSAITAVVVENTIGVQAVFDLPLNVIAAQICSVMDDIGTDAVKIGMLSSSEIVRVVAELIKKYDIKTVVIDPVMVAKSGDALLAEDARAVLKHELLPLATVLTPNLPEAEVLLGREIRTLAEMRLAAADLVKLGAKAVVVKGGHRTSEDDAVDVLFDGIDYLEMATPFIDTRNTHGTGCTFSSAIAAGLAKGLSVAEAVRRAKEYITAAITDSLNIGHGYGPTNHLTGVKSVW